MPSHDDRTSVQAGSLYESLALVAAEMASLYQSIDSTRGHQRSLIAAGEFAALEELLESRQSLVARLQAADEQLRPLYERWDRGNEPSTSEQRAWVEAQFGVIAELATRIARDDESDNVSLLRKREEVAAEIHGLTASRVANSAYRERSLSTPKFQDREG